MATFQLTINKKVHSVEAEPDMPLLWAIRDIVGMTGTNFGCGIAQCGACTVHLDGLPMRSCCIPLSGLEGREITTIEGLSEKTDHPVQAAWAEIDVPQCGYCQSGQMMTAAALLERKPNPTDEEIDRAMKGNICRCGTYPRIRKAIRRASELKNGMS